MANIKRNLAYNFVLSCSQLLLPLLSIPYVSRILDPAGIGKVGFIDSFTYYFVIIAEFGITTYGVREVARCQGDPVRLNTLVPQLLTLHIISSGITAVFYAAGIMILWDKIGDGRLVLCSISFFIAHCFACEWYFMGREKFGYIALRSIVVRLLGLASIFILVKQPDHYYLYYAAFAGSALATSIWNNLVMFREIRFAFRRVAWQQHLRFVWVTYLISLFYSVPLMLDNVLVGLVSSATMVGLYSFSVKVVRIGSTILTDSFLVFFPRIVSLSSEMKEEQLLRKLSLNLQFIILLAVPMGVGLFLLADELALVFFGNKFADTGINLRILAAFPLVKGLSLFLSNPVLIAQHREKAVLKNLALSSGLFIILALAFAYGYGATGGSIALMAAELILLLGNVISVRRHFPRVSFNGITMLQALAAALVFIPVTYLFQQTMQLGALRLAFIILCCILIYGITLLLMKNEFITHILHALKTYRNKAQPLV